MYERQYEIELHLKPSDATGFVKALKRINNFTVATQVDKNGEVTLFGVFEKGKKMLAARKLFLLCEKFGCHKQLSSRLKRDFAHNRGRYAVRKDFGRSRKSVTEQKISEIAQNTFKMPQNKVKKVQKTPKKAKKVGFLQYILNYWRQ